MKLNALLFITVCGLLALPAAHDSHAQSARLDLDELTARLHAGDREAARLAVDALMSEISDNARKSLASAVSEGRLEKRLETGISLRLRAEMNAHRRMRKWIRTDVVREEGEEPSRLRAVAADTEGICRLIRSVPHFWRAGRPTSYISGGHVEGLYVSFGADSEVQEALLDTLPQMPSTLDRAPTALMLFKCTGGGLDGAQEAKQLKAVRFLLSAIETRHDDSAQAFRGMALDLRRAMSVRFAAIADLRIYSPEHAETAAAKMAAEEFSDEEIAGIKRALVEGDTVGVRCEAMLLLDALGKTEETAAELRPRLEAADNGDKKARLSFALLLLDTRIDGH